MSIRDWSCRGGDIGNTVTCARDLSPRHCGGCSHSRVHVDGATERCRRTSIGEEVWYVPSSVHLYGFEKWPSSAG
jgi:hypothetical protein